MKHNFISNFAQRLDDFFAEKHALGFSYRYAEYRLFEFDRFCQLRFPKETLLTREVCLEWSKRHENESNQAMKVRHAPVREFARYLLSIGETAYVLPSNLVQKGHRYLPHIFTLEELDSIWQITDSLPEIKRSPVRHLVIPTVYRLIYCCGLRPAEARKLTVSDIEFSAGKIYIRESKGHKDRIVIMAEDVANMCREYDESVDAIMPGRVPFFPNACGEVYSDDWLAKTFKEICKAVNMVQVGDKAPRCYDFRHTYASHRLYQWMREGKDLSAMLPYLSAYMGHTHFKDTAYYIHLCPVLFESMAGADYSRFENLLPEVECDE